MKAGSTLCKLPVKTTEDAKEIQEATKSPAAAKETSLDAATVAVLSEGDSIFASKDE